MKYIYGIDFDKKQKEYDYLLFEICNRPLQGKGI